MVIFPYWQKFSIIWLPSGTVVLEMIRRVVYTEKENEKYSRTFATTTIININPSQDIVLDFYEEYVQPYLLMKQDFDKPHEDEYSHQQDELKIVREKKFSVVMNRENALRMARAVLEKYGEEVGVRDERV